MKNNDPMWLQVDECYEYIKNNYEKIQPVTDKYQEVYRHNGYYFTCFFSEGHIQSIGRRVGSEEGQICSVTGPSIVSNIHVPCHEFWMKRNLYTQSAWEKLPEVIEARVCGIIGEVLDE